MVQLNELVETLGERLYSCYPVTKINRRDSKASRTFVLTNASVLNVKGANHVVLKRRIPLSLIEGVVLNDANTKEFILKVPSEYDYRFLAEDRETIIADLRLLKCADALHPAEFTTWEARNKEYTRCCRHRKGGAPALIPENKTVAASPKLLTSLSAASAPLLHRESRPQTYFVETLSQHRSRTVKLVESDGVRYVEATYIAKGRADSSVFREVKHPTLVSIKQVEWGETVPAITVTSEHCANGDLGRLLGYHAEGLQSDATRLIAIEVATALSTLHANDVTFCELRPSKVLFTADFCVKLLYPGFSPSQLGSEPSSIHSEYRSSEEGPSGDWWSFGVLLHEMTHGTVPLIALEEFAPEKVLSRDFAPGPVNSFIVRLLSPLGQDPLRTFPDHRILAYPYLQATEDEKDQMKASLRKMLCDTHSLGSVTVNADFQFSL